MKRYLAILLILSIFITSCGGGTMNRTATIETNMGVIKITLFEDKMPITTKNFIDLAEKGFYDGSKFHRVIGPAKAPPSGFMIQGGDPLTKDDSKKAMWGTGGPGYTIQDEFVEGLSNKKGTIAMANTGQANSGGSQFFINLGDNSFLDFNKQPLQSKHPVFGEVVEGLDVIEKIARVETDRQDKPVEDVVIEKVTIR